MPLGTTPLITILGGGGFIGRYVCEALFKTGSRLRVAGRDPLKAFFLQPLAAIGQLDLVGADLARPETIARAVEGASAVINLVGIFKGDLQAIHVDGAGHAAKAARDAGASAFVQVSALGVSPDSASAYGRSKALGEAAVRDAFAQATIVRPSVVFGPEDEFTNRFAQLAQFPVLPVIAPATRFQPLFVRDLGQAIAAAALDPGRFGGRTFELGGPDVMTMRDLNGRVAAMAGRSPALVDVPDLVSGGMARLGFLPGAPLSKDQWLMLQTDNVVSEDASGIDAFGIVPTPMEVVAPDWLGRFVRGGRFAARATA